jgi:predicted dehydrogenase
VLKSFHGARIAWLSDVNAERARALGAAFGVPSHRMADGPVAFPDCDVALIATPVHARRSYLEYFASRGVAILAEKPFALSEREHREYLALCGTTPVSCGYMRRTYANLRALRRMIAEGWLGALRGIRYAEGARVGNSGSASPTLDRSYLEGGGVLRDLGCHGLDALIFMTGADNFSVPRAAIAWDGDTDREVLADLTLSGGGAGDACPVEFALSWLAPQDNAVVLEFDRARVRAGVSPEPSLEIQGSLPGSAWTPLALDVPGARSSYQAFYLEWRSVLQGRLDGNGGELAAAASLTTTRLVDAIYARGRAAS